MPRTAIIGGGARGIGRCLVRRFLERGYRVFVFDIDGEELKHTAGTHLKKYSDSGALVSAICNLRDVEDIRAKVKQAAEFLGGRVDVLINNGGIAAPKWKDGKTMADPATLAEWQAYVETNLTAPFALSQACVPYMAAPNAAAGPGSVPGDEKGTSSADLNEDKDVEDHPTNRAGRPEDIADAVEYLVNAGFVTGQDITVDGGALIKKS
ncbi:hypothetical protein DL764_007797 [Monosporascus ibericus]|uniref:Short-chain dehydrogenase/reductase SDR n=1 Tax=Monosporascus ibericus TaxID=155417 RepID=A0A4Q4SZ53_9PEZI|nr:hypothetical protein DL764_007797 [Monosporascus ibericus]